MNYCYFQNIFFFVTAQQVQTLQLGIYRLLRDHYLNSPSFGMQVYPAGSTITEGIDVPAQWSPTVDVEPLNIFAVEKYFAAGPRMNQGPINSQFGLVAAPVTYWKQVSPGQWQLTGLGVSQGTIYVPQVGRIE